MDRDGLRYSAPPYNLTSPSPGPCRRLTGSCFHGHSQANDNACKPFPRPRLSAFGNLFVDLPESDSRYSAAKTQSRGAACTRRSVDLNVLQAALRAVCLPGVATTQKGRSGSRLIGCPHSGACAGVRQSSGYRQQRPDGIQRPGQHDLNTDTQQQECRHARHGIGALPSEQARHAARISICVQDCDRDG
jgi:hypothetical protein